MGRKGRGLSSRLSIPHVYLPIFPFTPTPLPPIPRLIGWDSRDPKMRLDEEHSFPCPLVSFPIFEVQRKSRDGAVAGARMSSYWQEWEGKASLHHLKLGPSALWEGWRCRAVPMETGGVLVLGPKREKRVMI